MHSIDADSSHSDSHVWLPGPQDPRQGPGSGWVAAAATRCHHRTRSSCRGTLFDGLLLLFEQAKGFGTISYSLCIIKGVCLSLQHSSLLAKGFTKSSVTSSTSTPH